MKAVLRGIVAAIAVVSFGLVASGCTEEETLSGYTRTPTDTVAEVELPLVAGGGVLPAAAEPGALRVVYFGYTTCPDVCPTTMSDLKRALADLPAADRDRVEVVMVTIDPDRDVDEKLDAYVTTFIEGGRSSRITDPEELAAVAEAFGASYEVRTADDGEIEVSHSADLYVVDDAGDIILQWPFGTPAEGIGQDLESLLRERAST